MISFLILLTGMVLSYVFVFPYLRETKVESWQDLIKILSESGKVVIIGIVGILIASILDNLFSQAPTGSPLQAALLVAMFVVCFYGVEIFVLSRPKVEIGEKIFVRGLYPLALILLFQRTITHHLGLTEGTFLVGIGMYLIGLAGLWLLSYWPRVQPGLADPVGILILVGLYFFKKYLDTGEVVNIHEPNFLLGYWPVTLILFPALVLSLVFWKAKNWRKTGVHRLTVLLHVFCLVYALPYLVLLGTGDISPRLLAATVRYNQIVNREVEICLSLVDKKWEVDQIERQVQLYHKLIKNNQPLPDWATEEWLKEAYINLRLAEEERLRIWKNRPRKVLNPWAMLYQKIVGVRKTVPAMYDKFRKEVIGI